MSFDLEVMSFEIFYNLFLFSVMHMELGKTRAEMEQKKLSRQQRFYRYHQNQKNLPSRSFSPTSTTTSSSSFSNVQVPPSSYLCHNCFVPGHYRVGLKKGFQFQVRPRSVMDNAFDFESKDCGFESHRGHFFIANCNCA